MKMFSVTCNHSRCCNGNRKLQMSGSFCQVLSINTLMCGGLILAMVFWSASRCLLYKQKSTNGAGSVNSVDLWPIYGPCFFPVNLTKRLMWVWPRSFRPFRGLGDYCWQGGLVTQGDKPSSPHWILFLSLLVTVGLEGDGFNGLTVGG